VTYLQTLLCSIGDPIAVDGKFGSGTEKAVKAFQTQYSLTADGVVGPVTWDALEKATGHHGDEDTNVPGKSISMADWNAIRAAVAVLAQAVRKYEGGDAVG
jgi:peptidoglycan hydrolase-like protein with peptidoglycan-binding domain